MSLLSLFRRHCPAAANAERIRGINGLRAFPTESHERDPRSPFSQSYADATSYVRLTSHGGAMNVGSGVAGVKRASLCRVALCAVVPGRGYTIREWRRAGADAVSWRSNK